MGLLDFLITPPDGETAVRLVREGQVKLWQRQFGEAASALGKAARCPQTKAVALAYRSLLKRMQQDVPGALKDADAAVAAKPDLFEAHFAMIAALLTGQGKDRLTGAMEAWGLASKCVPQDVEAHFLKLVMLMLFAEMVTNGAEDASGVTVNFRHTPVVRGAIRLLDGYPDLAAQDFAGVDRSDPSAGLAQMGRGMALYRQGLKDAARAAWNLALMAFKGQMSKDIMSLKRLMAEVAAGEKAA